MVAGGCTYGSFRIRAPGSAQYLEVLTAPVTRWWRCWAVVLVVGAVPVGVRGELGEIVILTADLGGPRAERSANFSSSPRQAERRVDQHSKPLAQLAARNGPLSVMGAIPNGLRRTGGRAPPPGMVACRPMYGSGVTRCPVHPGTVGAGLDVGATCTWIFGPRSGASMRGTQNSCSLASVYRGPASSNW
jgi:hypothetical protein